MIDQPFLPKFCLQNELCHSTSNIDVEKNPLNERGHRLAAWEPILISQVFCALLND